MQQGYNNLQDRKLRADREPPSSKALDVLCSTSAHPILKNKLAGIIYNPSSGSGKAQSIAEAVRDELTARGIDVILKKSSREYEPTEIDGFLQQLDFVMVAGGDGTVMGLLTALARSGKPVFMLPSGNESLFARSFGMQSQGASVISALQKPTLSQHHFASVNGRAFFTMLSLGFDSEVTKYIASYRNGPIGHSGYIVPVLRTLLTHRIPKISLIVNGRKAIDGEKGYLIIANSKEYAGNLNLVPEADSKLNVLHARFFPGHSHISVISWLLKYALGLPVNLGRSILFIATKFEVETADKHYPMQADGEFVGPTPATVEICSAKISVVNGSGNYS